MEEFWKRWKPAIILAIVAIVFIWLCVLVGRAQAADVPCTWNASAGATGYKLYQSTNGGTTWSTGTDVGNVTAFTLPGVPDTGLVMIRVSAYSANGETINFTAGAWYCGNCGPPPRAVALGIPF